MRFNQKFQKTDLSGKWEFAYSKSPIKAMNIRDIHNRGLTVYPAQVPGNFELDLQANDVIPDPYFGANIKLLRQYEKMYVCYFRKFDIEIKPDKDFYLVFEGLDCIADVYINGTILMSPENMMIGHEADCSFLLKNGVNEILVSIRPPGIEALKYEYPVAVSGFHANYESMYIRKPAHMFGWDILPRIISAGIFKPVYIEHKEKIRFSEVYLQTSSLSGKGADSVFFYKCDFKKNPDEEWTIKLTGRCKESVFSEEFILSFQYGKHIFTINSPLLWNSKGRGDANIYDVKAELSCDGILKTSVSFTHGVRSVELLRKGIEKSSDSGEFVFIVNGEEIFAKGTNWVAADAFHSRDSKRIPSILKMAADINCNMIRCWGGNLYEDDEFYDICDREGILIWQDFAMACAIYPQDEDFTKRLKDEAKAVIKRLRQHPCLALWAGDNECDQAHSWFGFNTNPNTNILTRKVLPESVRQHDPFRSYLPSSPYLDKRAFGMSDDYLPENHLWGLRDYFKSDYYAKSTCLFASEMGYHGCPSPESIKKFISPDNVWPYDNEEWLLHSTSPLPEIDKRYNFRVELMANQIKVLFGEIPDNLEEFSRASQISQAEAKKFFIELFRGDKQRRTGILWWNLMDGWPQFSDAIVDYYFNKKLAYEYIKRSQRDILLLFREPENGGIELVASNLTHEDSEIQFTVIDADTEEILLSQTAVSKNSSITSLGTISFDLSKNSIYMIKWSDTLGTGSNHYLAGSPPYDFKWYESCMKKLKKIK